MGFYHDMRYECTGFPTNDIFIFREVCKIPTACVTPTVD